MKKNRKVFHIRRQTASAMAVVLAVLSPGVFPAGLAMAESAGTFAPNKPDLLVLSAFIMLSGRENSADVGCCGGLWETVGVAEGSLWTADCSADCSETGSKDSGCSNDSSLSLDTAREEKSIFSLFFPPNMP